MVLSAAAELRVVAEASDCVEAIRLARETAPDLALLDVRMPRLDGISATRRIVADPVLARLTPRETEVLLELAHGKSNADIAAALYLGEGTVKTHVAALLRKLQVRDRVQAAVAAYELGLVRPGMNA